MEETNTLYILTQKNLLVCIIYQYQSLTRELSLLVKKVEVPSSSYLRSKRPSLILYKTHNCFGFLYL